MKKNKLNRVLSIFLSCSAVAFMMSCSHTKKMQTIYHLLINQRAIVLPQNRLCRMQSIL